MTRYMHPMCALMAENASGRAAVERGAVLRGEEEKVKSCGTVPAAGPVSVVAAHHLNRYYPVTPAAPRLPPASAGVPPSYY